MTDGSEPVAPNNPFRRHCQQLVDWASTEELTVSLRSEMSDGVAAMKYYLDASAR